MALWALHMWAGFLPGKGTLVWVSYWWAVCMSSCQISFWYLGKGFLNPKVWRVPFLKSVTAPVSHCSSHAGQPSVLCMIQWMLGLNFLPLPGIQQNSLEWIPARVSVRTQRTFFSFLSIAFYVFIPQPSTFNSYTSLQWLYFQLQLWGWHWEAEACVSMPSFWKFMTKSLLSFIKRPQHLLRLPSRSLLPFLMQWFTSTHLKGQLKIDTVRRLTSTVSLIEAILINIVCFLLRP